MTFRVCRGESLPSVGWLLVLSSSRISISLFSFPFVKEEFKRWLAIRVFLGGGIFFYNSLVRICIK